MTCLRRPLPFSLTPMRIRLSAIMPPCSRPVKTVAFWLRLVCNGGGAPSPMKEIASTCVLRCGRGRMVVR